MEKKAVRIRVSLSFNFKGKENPEQRGFGRRPLENSTYAKCREKGSPTAELVAFGVHEVETHVKPSENVSADLAPTMEGVVMQATS